MARWSKARLRATSRSNVARSTSEMSACSITVRAASAWVSKASISLERVGAERASTTAGTSASSATRLPLSSQMRSVASCRFFKGQYQSADVRCLRALLALSQFELHALVLAQRLEATALDFLEVVEEVLAAAIGGDEAEALALVEPCTHRQPALAVGLRRSRRGGLVARRAIHNGSLMQRGGMRWPGRVNDLVCWARPTRAHRSTGRPATEPVAFDARRPPDRSRQRPTGCKGAEASAPSRPPGAGKVAPAGAHCHAAGSRVRAQPPSS